MSLERIQETLDLINHAPVPRCGKCKDWGIVPLFVILPPPAPIPEAAERKFEFCDCAYGVAVKESAPDYLSNGYLVRYGPGLPGYEIGDTAIERAAKARVRVHETLAGEVHG